jgi:catechol 2,3-dioxygenase-like lactoylglutathione lyase family enzyme
VTRLVVAAIALLGAAAVAAAQPQRPRVTGVSHAAFYVHDIGAARAFYGRFLGFPEDVTHPEPGDPAGGAVFRVNDRQFIELRPEVEPGGDRLSHIGLETSDAEAMRLYLKARGIGVPDRVSRTTRQGDSHFSVRDPDGHDLEFVQYGTAGYMTHLRQWKGPPTAVSSVMPHVGVLVGSLDSALAFYRDILGFKETWRGSRDEKELNWVNVRVPDGQDYIEFMLYGELPAPSKRGSQHHICLFVPEIGKALAALQERATRAGYQAAMEPRTGINRKRQLNLFDPDGTRSELMEPATIDGVPAPSSQAPPPRR